MSSIFRNSSRRVLIPRRSSPSYRCNHAGAASPPLDELVAKSTPVSTGYLNACQSHTVTPQIRAKPLLTQLYSYSQHFQYDLLLEAFVKWTSTEFGISSLRKELSQDQISYFLGKIVNHQKYLIHELANSDHSLLTTNKEVQNIRDYRFHIREVYSRLLYGSQSEESIYDISKRNNLYNSENLTTYRLNKMDYENLIAHELFNKKLDLASKWFKRYEEQFPRAIGKSHSAADGEVESMSSQMWLDKFRVYSCGQPYTWEIPNSDIYVYIRKGYNKFKSAKHWKEIFEEYTNFSYNNPQINSAEVPLLDNQLCQTLIYAAGHLKNTPFIIRFIEEMWGIDAQGKLVKNGTFPVARGDPKFPDLDLLQAISVAFSYNRQFYQGMTYINSFQEHYPGSTLDLASRRAIPFWNSVIEWAEKLSRYNPDLALRHYLKTKQLNHLLKENTKSQRKHKMEQVSRLELANDADFDQEDFNEYIEGLKSERFKSFDALWKLYRASNTHFSAKLFGLKLKLAQEFKMESDLFDFLRATNEVYDSYKVPEDVYLGEASGGKELTLYSRHIYLLHTEGIKSIIQLRGEDGFLGLVGPLVEEWSLDLKMEKILRNWYLKKEPDYREALEDRRLDIMVKQKSEKFEDAGDDGLLDLF